MRQEATRLIAKYGCLWFSLLVLLWNGNWPTLWFRVSTVNSTDLVVLWTNGFQVPKNILATIPQVATGKIAAVRRGFTEAQFLNQSSILRPSGRRRDLNATSELWHKVAALRPKIFSFHVSSRFLFIRCVFVLRKIFAWKNISSAYDWSQASTIMLQKSDPFYFSSICPSFRALNKHVNPPRWSCGTDFCLIQQEHQPRWPTASSSVCLSTKALMWQSICAQSG